jgi:RND family efflux transporter MFP subunit
MTRPIPCFNPRLSVALALLAALAGCGKEAEKKEEQKAPVKVATAKEETFGEWTELLGVTQPLPNHAARVTAAVEGHVHSLLHDEAGKPIAEGQHVAKGQVIVQLDDRAARASRDKARAGVAELEELKRQADIAEQIARLDVERLEKLQPAGANEKDLPLVSKIELAKARLTHQDAQAKQKAAEARLRGARADLDGLEVHLNYHKLTAPISGTLSAVQASPGQTLAVGTVVADVVDLGEIEVVCFAPRSLVSQLKVGQPARLKNGGGASDAKDSPGRVTYVAVQAQPETGNFMVKVRIPNRDGALRSNTVVRVQALTQPEEPRLAIDDDALLEDQDPPAVVIIEEKTEKDEHGKEETVLKARKLTAEIGVRDTARHLVEIRGLKDPETKEDAGVPLKSARFVIEGGHGLHSKDEVKLKEEEHKD